MGTVTHDFSGEVVVVTGGGRGLGRAIAEGFARAGSQVAIIGRDADRLMAAAAEMPGDVRAYSADVGDEQAIETAAARILSDFGKVDVLVNNAGINPWYRSADKVSMEEWRTILNVNLTAAFHCCLLFGRPMLDLGKGSIISISSVAGHVGLARSAAYNAAKGGLELMTKSLAIDWASRGVRVNTVAPGYFETDLTAGLQGHEQLSGKILAHTPIGRFGKPEEVVGACLYLASSEAAYVTGHSIRVDGGFTAS